MSVDSFKLVIVVILVSILTVPLFAQKQFAQASEVRAEIVGLSSPVKVYRGSVIRVTASIKNTGTETRTFYAGASIIGEGETTWKNFGDATTPSIGPGSTGSVTFPDYTIPSDAYIGYHGIYVKVWTDSTKSTVVTDRWFEKVIIVGSISAEIVDLTITVIKP